MRQVALTTVDNPYDPFDDYLRWFAFDTANGYDSTSYLARIAKRTAELGPDLETSSIEMAIDEIVELNLSGRHKKVVRETP